MKEFVVYTVARIGLFVATYALIAGLYLLLTRGDALPVLWPLLLAAVLSAAASYPLLAGPRERFAASVERRAHNATRRFEDLRSREDAD